MDMLNDLHEMCDTLGRALQKANDKIRSSGGELSASDMDYVNKLTHALKSIVTTAAMKEAEEMDDGGSYGNYGSYGGSYDGGSYDSRSYARGRGRNARRDSMGRYSSRGYSRDGYSRDGYSREGGYSGHGEMVDELRDLMNQAPDEQTRQEFQRMIQKMEQR